MAEENPEITGLLMAKGLYINEDGVLRSENMNQALPTADPKKQSSMSTYLQSVINVDEDKASKFSESKITQRELSSDESLENNAYDTDSLVVQYLKALHYKIFILLIFCLIYPIVVLFINKDNLYDKRFQYLGRKWAHRL